jgi:uncharacterized protein (TIGR03435 family)
VTGWICFFAPDLSSQISTPSKIVAPAGSAAEELPSFEVATIKPAKQENYKMIGLYVYPGGRIFAGQSTLKMLVRYAFNVQDFQIEGGPHWADDDLYEISALPPESSASRKSKPRYINDPPSEEQREMLQSLLIERFGLKFHRTTKEGDVYFLVRSNKPLRLEEAKHKEYFSSMGIGGMGNGGMSGQTVSMPFMAIRLSRYLEHPVLDQTGLTGLFDFKLDPPSEDSREESQNDFIDGIFESVTKLGLQLKKGKGPTEIIVIDDVKRPTAN